MRGEQAIFNLEIKKKSGLSINPDIHHSKVFSSGYIRFYLESGKYANIKPRKPFSDERGGEQGCLQNLVS